MNPFQAQSRAVGPALMISAAIQFAVMNFAIKVMGPEFSAWHIAFYRFFGSVLVLLALFSHKGNPFKSRNYPLLVLRGFTGSLAFLCIVGAIRMLPLSTSMVITYTYPAFAALFAVILYGDRIRWAEGGCIAVVILGAWTLFEFHISGRLLGQVLALSGAVLVGFTVTLIRALRLQNGPVVIYLYMCTAGTLLTLPAFWMDPRLPATPLQWALCLTIVLFAVTAQVSMNQGFFHCRSWEGGLYMTLDAVFSLLAGILFLDEPLTWRLFAGSGLILCGVGAMNVISIRRTALPEPAVSGQS